MTTFKPGEEAVVSVADADVCAALEYEIERWRRLRKSQGSPAPGCTPGRYVDYLFGRSYQRAAAAMRGLECRGLVRRRRFDCGGNAWALTPAGSALAQEGTLWCRACLHAEALLDRDAYGCCAACAADYHDERAVTAEGTAAYWAKHVDEFRAKAHKHRDRAEALRAVAAAS